MTIWSLVDTGATTSIIDRDLFEEARINNSCIEYTPARKELTVLDGRRIQTSGSATILTEIKSRSIPLNFCVIDNFPEQLLLGVDNLSKINIKIHLKDNNGQPQYIIGSLNNSSSLETAREEIRRELATFESIRGPTPLTKHHIKIKSDCEPIKFRYAPRNPAMQEIIDQEIDKMLQDDVIEPSNSPWSSPIVIVKKKDKKYRFCIDFRKINKISEKDAYPLPHINQTLDKLRNAKIISTIDLKNGYWQVPLTEESKAITAFTVPRRGLFQFKVMPFGLHSASATFQRLLSSIITPDLEPYVEVYLDDIVVIGETLEEHMTILRKVFQKLKDARLRINTEKSKFLQDRIVYLGHVIDGQGIRTDPEKVKAIREIPPPTNTRELRQFIGMTSWYRRFIQNCSELTRPLTALLKKRRKWHWSNEEQEAFDALKTRLSTAPVLAPPDFTREFTLQTDASKDGLGAVLTQDFDDQERVIAYASRTLNKAEVNYSTTEKECLAVVWGIQKMRPYLEGYHFRVITDHQSLKWISTLESPTGRIARWSLYLQQFDYEIVYRRGKLNKVADALSRNPLPTDPTELSEAPLEETIIVASLKLTDPWYTRILNGIKERPDRYPEYCLRDDKLYRHMHHSLNYAERDDAWKLCIPESMRERILEENHDAPTAGHLGITKTVARISRRYFWPRMHADVAKYVRSCDKCQEFKPSQQATPGKMGTSNTTRPWEIVSIDIIGPKPRSSSGHCYILVMQDKFTKWVETQPMRQAKAPTIVKIVKEKVVLRFGSPKTIITDNGSQFISKEFTALLDEYGINHQKTPVYSPQCNPVERANRVIGTMISQFITKTHRTWDKYLPELTFAMNTAKHESTQFSPAYLNYGREVDPPKNFRAEAEAGDTCTPYDHQERLRILKDAVDLVKVNLARAFTKQSRHYNKNKSDWAPKVGELVSKREHHLSSAAGHFSSKLAEKYTGNFKVTRILGNNVYEVEKDSQKYKVHVKDLKPYSTRT